MRKHDDLASAITRSPMIRVVVPFIFGLLLARYFQAAWIWYWGLFVAALSFAFWLWAVRLKYALRWLPGVGFILLFVVMGGLRQRLAAVQLREDHIQNTGLSAEGFELEVAELSSVKERTVRAWADVTSALVEGKPVPAEGRVLLTLMRDTLHAIPAVGDRLLVRGLLEPIDRTPDPGGFDQRLWAAYHGAAFALFAPAEKWQLIRANRLGSGFFADARTSVAQWLRDSGLPSRERALAKAILLGMRDELEPEQNQAFVRSGTIHVLAVSGTHVGIIYVAVVWGLVRLGKGRRARLLRGAIALCALWMYAGLTGFTPSVLRATVMFSLFTIAEMVQWRIESINNLAAAAFLLLMWDPVMLGQLGFQLSFLAVLGIAVFYKPINLAWTPPNSVATFFWSLIAVSLAAQAFTIPLCLYMFHAFPVWFLPANMAIVTLVGFGVYGAIAVVLLHAVPVLGPMLSVGLKWLLMLLGTATGFFATLPGAYPAVRVGWWGMVGMYALLVFFASWVLQGRRSSRSITLGLLSVLLCGWAWTAHERNGQRNFTVYDDKDNMMCSLLDGRTLYAFRTAASERLDAKLEAHARNAGISRVVICDSIPQVITAGDRKVLLLPIGTTPAPWDPAQNVGEVVLYGSSRMARQYASALRSDTAVKLVLASSLSSFARRDLRHWSDTNGLRNFDMRANGAYVSPR
ncbi:MAG: ComEC/Rec2 family competence protein [Flavobacteriales bacterium]